MIIAEPTDLTPLDNYYEMYRASDELMEQHLNIKHTIPSPDITRSVSFQTKSPGRIQHMRHRSISDATALFAPGQQLSPHHPALSLPDFVLTFGPLIFPLHRAALMRKRILLVSEAPVEKACNFGRTIAADLISFNIMLTCEQSMISPSSLIYHSPSLT